MGLRQLIVAGVLLATTQVGVAADSGFYFGVLGGHAEYDFEQPQLPFDFVTPPLGTPSLSPGFIPNPLNPIFDRFPPFFAGEPAAFAVARPFLPTGWLPRDDDQATAWGGLVGYRIGRYAAAELSYLDLGTLHTTRDVLTGPILNPVRVPLKRELETRGPALSALGLLPLSKVWDLYLRVGVIFADMELSSRLGDSSSSSATFGSEALLWGGGAQFHWGGHWSLRVDFQRFENVGDKREAGEADINLLSLGVLYRL
jgi:OmpA-like transmembrane domain